MQDTNTKNQELLTQIENSPSVKMLVPSYQQALRALAEEGSPAARQLSRILTQENPHDLQSQYFTEETLENFVARSLTLTVSPEELRLEFALKAERLIRAFLFFDSEQVESLVKPLGTLPLEGLQAIIAHMRQGHRKQSEYLDIFTQKDPKFAIKFELIASGAYDHHTTIKKP